MKKITLYVILAATVALLSTFFSVSVSAAGDTHVSSHMLATPEKATLFCQNSFVELYYSPNSVQAFNCAGLNFPGVSPNTLYRFDAHSWSGYAEVSYVDQYGSYVTYEVDYCNNDIDVFGTSRYYIQYIYLSSVKEPWC